MKKGQKTKRQNLAQSATELAIFGGMLVFLISAIVRTGLNASLQMNAVLRTLRIALSESYRTAEGEYAHFKNHANARNSASIFVVEDRLMVTAASKYGTQDRAPFYAMANATMSHNLFNPMDPGDFADIPLMDVFVNGQRFPVAMGGFKTITLNSAAFPVCPNTRHPPADPPPYGACWDQNLVFGTRRMAYMYTTVGNYPASEEWCDGVGKPCPTGAPPAGNMSADQRFDLNFDGIPDVPVVLRPNFFWQWFRVRGVNSGVDDCISLGKQKNVFLDADGDYHTETILEAGGDLESGHGLTTYLSLYDPGEGDMDVSVDARDPGEWRRVESVGSGSCGPTPSGTCLIATPPTETNGDYFGQCYRWRCQAKKFGLLDDIQMYSFTTPGGGQPQTYLAVREGKLLNPVNGQFMRSTNRHDQLDIIERRFRLNKNTERFCSLSGVVTNWSARPPQNPSKNWLNGLQGLTNPVEACNDCFSTANISKTCMDVPSLTILIRSRVEDVRRRRWTRRYSL